MNKVLLIYTGHLRTWDKCRHDHYEKLWTPHTTPFFHTYEDPKEKDCKWIPIPGEYWELDGVSHPYNQHRRNETSVANTFNQWHNNFIGFCLAPKGFDVYVRVRPDITFGEKIDFENYDYSGQDIYIPHGHRYWGQVNDQIGWGNYEVMKKYYSVYLNHAEIFKHGKIFHTEGYVTENLERQGVKVIDVPIDNYVIRE